MSNSEKFNAMLNACENPQAIYDALLALASTGFFERYVRERDAARKEAGTA